MTAITTRLFLSSNQAVAEGALDAGMNFFAGYPITPSSDLMEYLAKRMLERGGVFYQAEDELAAINAIIGASWAGAKAMTATSGPGFSLMAEGIGFAAMVEAPIVIVNNMRAGPSTGIATAPSQGDVLCSRWCSHGDYPVVVLAPYSAQEAYDLTIKAFNIAEKLRIPVILLQDAILAHAREPVVRRKTTIVNRKKPTLSPSKYKPFEPDPEDLVPPMAIYGEGYHVIAESLCHDEEGFYDPSPETYNRLVSRLVNKIRVNMNIVLEYSEYLTDNADYLFISFGSTARSLLPVIGYLREKGVRAGLLRLKTLWPLPEDVIRDLSLRAKRVIVVEVNSGQLVLDVKRIVGAEKTCSLTFLIPDIPLPDEILERLDECVSSR